MKSGGKQRGALRTRRRNSLGFEPLESRRVMAVVISEFLAQNDSGLQDQDGDRTDWIELVNTEATPVDLTGWHLTDLSDDLDQWTFPATTLAGNGRLLIFASGKDRAVSGQELHTNFSLAQEGEYLALVMPDGVTVADAFDPFPEQLSDVSYGRGAQGTTTDGLIGEFGQLKYLVPTNNSVDVGVAATPWTSPAFDDASWTSGLAGLGYDVNGGLTNFSPYVLTNVAAQMNTIARTTAYIRMGFTVPDPAELSTLKLRIRYDDGIAVYLNGTRITAADRRVPATPPLGFGSSSASTQPDASAILYEDIDLTASKNLLVAGNNVLAIHGLNRNNNSTNWGDFLIDPLLEATRLLPPVTGYMVNPTPGAANSTGTAGLVADTTFSVDRGFFTEPFTVEIATTTADAEIRYTTDGSTPTATNGLVYNPASPPLISTTTTLRAAAFKPGFTPTNVDTQTYIFLDDVIQQNGAGLPPVAPWGYAGPDWAVDPDVVNHPTYSSTIIDDLKAVPTVSLVMNWNDWFGGGGQGIYPVEAEIERAVSMEYFRADGSLAFQIDGGVEIQGGTSDDRWKMDKLSMRVKFTEPYGPEKLDASIFNGGLKDEGAATSFNTFILDAHLGYTWAYGGSSNPIDQRSRAMFVQDGYVSDLQNLAGGQAPHTQWVHLYLNGLYWGLYEMHERADEHFAESYLGGNDEDYDVIKHNATNVVNADVANPSSAVNNYAAMLNLVRQDMTVPANYAAAAAKIDVDDFITYMIVNYYVGNDDWAHQNWYASYNRVDPNGKWRYHSWDAENVLKDVNRNWTGDIDSGAPTEVFHLLMVNPEFRLKFNDQVQKFFYNGGLMTPANGAAVYQARMAEIDRAIVGESARWGDNHTTASDPPGAGNPYLRTHWVARQNDLLTNYFPVRTGIVANHFVARGWATTLGAPVFSQYGGTVSSGYQLTMAKPVGSPATGTLYYTLDGSDPRLDGGGISLSALAYGGPITITAGVHVRARIFDPNQTGTANDWSPEINQKFLLDTPFPLRITELNYNPDDFPGVADAQNLEFIELTNTGSESISLNGVQITQFADDGYTFANGLSLSPGERIIVAKNPAAFVSAYGPSVFVAPDGYGTQNLSNGGEPISLLGPLGETLQTFSYADGGTWPTAPDGNGKSLEIIDPLGDPTSPTNWRASFYAGGSPGTSGLPPALAGDFDADGDVDGNDFLLWQRGLGTQPLVAEASHGDADGDRDVDAADLGLWSGNFGQGGGEGEGGVAMAALAPVLADDEWILASADAAASRGEKSSRQRAVDAVLAAPGSTALGAPASSVSRGNWAPTRRLAFAEGQDHEALDAALAAGALAESGLLGRSVFP
jgi:hypothetical protein